MPRPEKAGRICLLLVVLAGVGAPGCELLELLLGIGPGGTPLPTIGVEVRIENQSGLRAKVVGSFFASGEDARITTRFLEANGPDAVSSVVQTRAERILLVATVDVEAVIPPEVDLQPGDVLAEAEFLAGIDFSGDQTLEFIIPPPPLPPGTGADCNENMVLDALDIQSGSSEDCNGNLVPDECEIDRNSTAPGGPFYCVPGEAECAPDCNNNGVPDPCDEDCNENGTPDDCELCSPMVGAEPLSSPARSGAGLSGPMVIGGDDLTDHGSRGPEGEPLDGWLFIQRALEFIRPQVTRPGADGGIAALGSSDSEAICCDAGAAISTAAAAAGIPVTFYDGPTGIAAFFDDLASGETNPSIIWTAGTDAFNDLTEAEGEVLTDNAALIAAFVNTGGGLLAHGTGEAAFGWLDAVLPGLVEVQSGEDGGLALTSAGQAALVGLASSDLNSGPWHNHFEGNFGGLKMLVASMTIHDAGEQPAAVIIGGRNVVRTAIVALGPVRAINGVGTAHVVRATVFDASGQPAEGEAVGFFVIEGPNSGVFGFEVTNDAGVAEFSYDGGEDEGEGGGEGTDLIRASVSIDKATFYSNIVEKIWVEQPCSLDCNENLVPDECEPDRDADGVIDECDECPEDAVKIKPGDCGCGAADLDSDEDGVPDCLDNCPGDPVKIERGICGCGVADVDTDEDGAADCLDPCPEDPENYCVEGF